MNDTDKYCPCCQQTFPRTGFCKQTRSKDGLQTYCRTCMRAKNRENYRNNSAKVIERTAKYHKENRERVNEWARKRYKDNPEKERGRQITWRQNNPDSVRTTWQKYKRANSETLKIADRDAKRKYRREQPERARAYDREYSKRPKARLTDKVNGHAKRARKRNADGHHTAAQELQQLAHQRGKCYYCGNKVGERWHPDHVIPLSRGGSNDISNIVIACETCNIRKNNKLPHEWPEGGRLL